MESEIVVFQGKRYYRYPAAPRLSDRMYFRRAGKLLHREVWKAHYGEIPDGFHVHHKDRNPANNDIENLELVEKHKHLLTHHKGASPKKFAHMRRIQPMATGWHKSEEGRAYHSKQAKRQYAERELVDRACQKCGRTYSVKWSRSLDRFCSAACRTAARRDSGIDDVEKVCEYCAQSFTSNKYLKRRFCSQVCANRARSAKRE